MMEAEYHMVLDYEMECRKDFEKGNLTVMISDVLNIWLAASSRFSSY